MVINLASLVPSCVPPQEGWADSLRLRDSAMAHLLGLASEHVSHLHELGLAECVGTVKVLELLGVSMVQLAVAHSIHLSDLAHTAAEASVSTTAAIPSVYEHLSEHLSVASTIRLGASLRGTPEQPSRRVLQMITAQAIGAYTFCAGYAKVRELVAANLDPQRVEGPSQPDFKTALLAYAQSIGLQADYAIIAESGPPHARTFTVRVRTDSKHEAEGAASSKKAAEQAAAERYIRQYAPLVVQARLARPHSRPKPEVGAPIISKARRNQLRSLANKLGINESGIGALHAALIHSSYHAEHPGTPDNRTLAHLGACVLDSIVTYRLSAIIFGASIRHAGELRGPVAAILGKNNPYLERTFDILGLNSLLLLGAALQGTSMTIRVEAFQAVLGAVLLGRTSPAALTDLLPKPLHQWLDDGLLRETPGLAEEIREANDAPKRKTIRCERCGRNLSEEIAARHIARCQAQEREETLAGVPVRNLPFTLLPPGTWDIRQVVEHYRKAAENPRCGWGDREFDPSRLEKIASLRPTHCYVGKESWRGYVVFQFANTDRVVLECPIEGNATYILGGNWKVMISSTKAELRTEYEHLCTRVIHKGIWLSRIRQALR